MKVYEEPHTHPLRETLQRNQVSKDVLQLTIDIRDIIKNEEMWYILQNFRDGVAYDAFLEGIYYAADKEQGEVAEKDPVEQGV